MPDNAGGDRVVFLDLQGQPRVPAPGRALFPMFEVASCPTIDITAAEKRVFDLAAVNFVIKPKVRKVELEPVGWDDWLFPPPKGVPHG